MHRLCQILIVVIAWLTPGMAIACPFCSGALELTYSQQIEDGVTAVIARQNIGRGERHQAGFVVLDVLKASDDFPIDPKQPIRVTAYSEGASGELYLIVAGRTDDGHVMWGPPQPITSQCRQYILQRPDYSRPRPERLAFYANYLEYHDSAVAVDAWTEFASAEFEDIAQIVDRLPHARLSAVMSGTRDKTTLLQSPDWLGLYGMLLGMCGDETDAETLEDLVSAPPDLPGLPRLGIDGVMGGLMLLKGEAGLDLIVSHIVNNPNSPTSDHLAVYHACTFMCTYASEFMPRARLEEVVRGYLHTPELTALVLTDLARWKNWESIAIIAEIHDDEAIADVHTQQKIVEFLLAAEREAASNPDADPTDELKKCLGLLETYRQQNATLVQGVEESVIR